MKQDRKNRNIAFAYFQAIGLIPKNAGKNEWQLHHKDVNLRHEDKTRYDEWRIEDLVPMLTHCHRRLHSRGRMVDGKTKQKISDSLTGHETSEKTRQKISRSVKNSKAFHDWVSSEEHRKEVSEQMKVRWAQTPRKEKPDPKPMEERGRFWITNGVEHRRIAAGEEIPAGWRSGRLGFKRKNNPKLGPMSEEHKRKISEAKKKR